MSSDRSGLARSSAAVAAGTALSRVSGLVRVVVLAAVLGRATMADAYNLANVTPNIVYELLVGGVLAATVVPVFVKEVDRGDDRSISAVFTVAMTALLGFTAVTMALTPLLARLFAIDTTGAERAAQLHVLTVLIVCFVPQMVFYGFTTLATALLNARHRFVAAAFAPVLNNLVVIGVLIVVGARTHRSLDVTDAIGVRNDLGLLLLLGIGTTAGIVAMALVLTPALARARVRLRPVFDWRDPAVRTIVRLSGWTAGYVITNQVAQFFVLILAKSGSKGNASAYIYAFMFYVVPHGLLAVSIMTTISPELARRAGANDMAGLRRDFAFGLRHIVVFVLAASALFATIAQPMLAVIVLGKFKAVDAAVTGDTLQIFALSLVPFSLYLYVMRAFYALHDTRTPFVLNLGENALNIALAIALFPTFGVQGLAMAWGIAYLVAAFAALVALQRRIGRIVDRGVALSLVRAAGAGLALAAVAAPLAGAIGKDSIRHALAATVAATAGGGLAYTLVLAATGSRELREITVLIRRRRATDR